MSYLAIGPDIECSKATGYPSSVSRERDREHSTQSVKERGSYSSSRYIHTYALVVFRLCKAEIIMQPLSHRESYSQDLGDSGSQDSESKPTKLVSVVTQVYIPTCV